MKKLFLTLALSLTHLFIYAQITTAPSSGYVGIGTANPGSELELVGNTILRHKGANLANASISDINFIPNGNFYNPVAVIRASFVGSNWYNGSRLSFFTSSGPDITVTPSLERLTIAANGNIGIGKIDPSGKLSLGSSLATNKLLIYDDNIDISGLGQGLSELRIFVPSSGTNHISFGCYTLSNDSFSEQMRLDRNGNLGIGTTNPDAKLAVNGTIHSTEVRVNMTGFPDYVFEPDYHLPPLAEVQAYIKLNHHLPEMPTEEEVSQNGINLGELNKLLVKKIEELTLYLIQQKEDFDKQNRIQQEQINTLRSQVIKLTENQ